MDLLVAGAGLEPATFGLWAQRATTAPPRDVIAVQSYNKKTRLPNNTVM